MLKADGHFCVSDVVIKGVLPEKLRKDAEMYAGCVSGALQLDDYINHIEAAGFKDIEVQKMRRIGLPHELLASYMDEGDIEDFSGENHGIFSITVTATK